MNLFNYGIQNEQSDLRAHVSVCNSTVYVFPTEAGQDVIKSGKYKARAAYTGQVQTASGFAIPVGDIRAMKSVKIPNDIFFAARFDERDNTSAKGNKAVFVVSEMIKRGELPIIATPGEITDKDLQIQGTDILVTAKCRIQVKCDWRAGQTRNVYLQVAERNLFKMY